MTNEPGSRGSSEDALSDADPLDDWVADYAEALRLGTPAPALAGTNSLEQEQLRDLLHLLDQALRPPLPETGVADAREDGGAAGVAAPVPGVSVPTLGRFVIEAELGRGGFGVVYRAYDPEMDRIVALKLPRSEALLTPGGRRRFFREARAAARLDHPNLVPVYEAGEAGSICYIASAYCEGPTLRSWLDDRGGPLDPRAAARLARKIAGAIAHMHCRGLLHCDLKPSNVLLERPVDPAAAPEPRVTDFGLAQLLEPVPAEQTASWPLGTLPYAAPEQIEQRVAALGPATDVYALGAILYEMLTGHRTHDGGSDWETRRAVVSDPPVPPRRRRRVVPLDLDAICLRCLEKRPANRYTDAEALADDLDRFLDGRPTVARPLDPLRRSVRWARRHPTAAAIVGMGLAMFVVSLGYAASLSRTVDRLDEANVRLGSALRDASRQGYVATLALVQEDARNGRGVQAQRRLRELIPDEGDPDPRDFAWHYLDRQLRRDRTVVASLTRAPDIVAAAADGTLMVVGEHLLAFWKYRQPEEADRPIIRPISGPPIHPAQVHDLGALAPSGNRFVLGDHTLPGATWIFERPGGPPWRLDARPIWSAAYSAEGHLLALGERMKDRGCVDLVDRPDGASILLIGDAQRLAFADRDRVVAAIHPAKPGDAGKVELAAYDSRSGARLYRFVDRGINETALAASPAESGPLATGSGRLVQLRDPATGAVIATLDGHAGNVHTLAFSPDGARLVSGDTVGRAVLWDVAARSPLAEIDDLGSRVLSADVIPGGSDVLLGVQDGLVMIWHPEPPAEPPTPAGHTGEVWSVAYSPDGRMLASGGDDHVVRIWDAASGRQLLALQGIGTLVTTLAFSPDGCTLAAGDYDGKIHLWGASAGRPLRSFDGHDRAVRALAFLSDRTLASAGRDGVVTLWDVAKGERIATPYASRKDLRALAVSPDGRTLATGGNDEEVLLWNVKAGTPGVSWTVSHDVTALAVSPDGRTLAVATKFGFVSLHDLHDGALRAELPLLHTAEIRGLAFSPDGRVLACAGLDGLITLVDPESGRRHLTLAGHGSGVHAISFSPDGRTLASGGFDGTVRLWWAGPGDPLTWSTPHAQGRDYSGLPLIPNCLDH